MFKVTIKVVGVGTDLGNVLASRQIMQRIRMTAQEMYSSNLGQNNELVLGDSTISEEEAWVVINLESSAPAKDYPPKKEKSLIKKN